MNTKTRYNLKRELRKSKQKSIKPKRFIGEVEEEPFMLDEDFQKLKSDVETFSVNELIVPYPDGSKYMSNSARTAINERYIKHRDDYYDIWLHRNNMFVEQPQACVIRARETHPFDTPIGLIGGGKKNKKGTKKKKPKQKHTGTVTVIPEGQNSTWNFACISTLTYLDTNIAKTNVGNQYIYWRMRMNDVYDPDPLIASGSLSGFAEMAAQYRRFLVLKLKVDIEVVNNESFPVIITIAPTDIDQALVITSGATAINLGEYPGAKSFCLASSTGMNRQTHRFTIHLPTFTGQAEAYKDSLSYSALVNTSPTILTFFNISAASATNFTAAGVTQRAQYRYRVYWSQRQTPNN
jgi:hypothetical protein